LGRLGTPFGIVSAITASAATVPQGFFGRERPAPQPPHNSATIAVPIRSTFPSGFPATLQARGALEPSSFRLII
jgi:hypothetical protein